MLVYWRLSAASRAANGSSPWLGAGAATGAGADPMAFTADWHQMMIEDFIEALATDREPVASGRSALAVHGLIAALEQSARERTTIEVTNSREFS